MKNIRQTKDCVDVSYVNNSIVNSIDDYINHCEEKYYNQLMNVANYTAENMCGKILLLSGPSASTKTTTAHKLSEQLGKMGVNSAVISLDNFFVNRENLPRLADGTEDFESINTLDLKTLDICFDELLNNRTSIFPLFDFKSGKRSDETIEISVDENSVVIVEGIHAIHPKITARHNPDDFIKIYITPYTNYYLNGEMLLSTRNLRLIRRMIRDYYYRHSSPSNTLDMWVNVVNSEVENIIPLKESADFLIDSAIEYEANVYAKLFGEIITPSSIKTKHQKKIDELVNILSHFHGVDLDQIPADTVIREFLI